MQRIPSQATGCFDCHLGQILPELRIGPPAMIPATQGHAPAVPAMEVCSLQTSGGQYPQHGENTVLGSKTLLALSPSSVPPAV